MVETRKAQVRAFNVVDGSKCHRTMAGQNRERTENRMTKTEAKLKDERRDERNEAKTCNEASAVEYCSSCGRRMSEVGGGDCEQCEARPALNVP